MNPDAVVWCTGLAVGLAAGIPVGLFLSRMLDPVDRWLDAHWRR